MKEERNDKGLRLAVKETPRHILPSNFVYRMMQKVDEAAMLRERRDERRMLWATIAASILLIAGCAVYINIYFGDMFHKTLSLEGVQLPEIDISFLPTYIYFMGIVAVLFFFDHWMRKEYFKRHQS